MSIPAIPGRITAPVASAISNVVPPNFKRIIFAKKEPIAEPYSVLTVKASTVHMNVLFFKSLIVATIKPRRAEGWKL